MTLEEPSERHRRSQWRESGWQEIWGKDGLPEGKGQCPEASGDAERSS